MRKFLISIFSVFLLTSVYVGVANAVAFSITQEACTINPDGGGAFTYTVNLYLDTGTGGIGKYYSDILVRSETRKDGIGVGGENTEGPFNKNCSAIGGCEEHWTYTHTFAKPAENVVYTANAYLEYEDDGTVYDRSAAGGYCAVEGEGPPGCIEIGYECEQGTPDPCCSFACLPHSTSSTGYACGGEDTTPLGGGDVTVPPVPTYSGPLVEYQSLITFLVSFLIPVAVGVLGIPLIIINSYKIMTSQGDPAKVADGKEGLTSAIIGILFVLLSLVILRVIINSLLGGSIGGP